MADRDNTARNPLSQETLNSLLRYDPETGLLFWCERPLSLFPDKRTGASWNGKFAGKKALNNPIGSGYLGGSIFNKKCLSHRIVWTMAYGSLDGEIDHINGDKTDNRLANLRVISRRDNQRNLPLRKNSASGHSGISWIPKKGRWRATIGTKYLGYFENIEDAIAARRAAEAEHGYHPNHGRKPNLERN